jgi:hypothetical protein
MSNFVQELLGPQSTYEIVPYYRLAFHFDYPTSAAGATDYTWQRQLTALDANARAILLDDILGYGTGALPPIELPVGLVVPMFQPIEQLADVNRTLQLMPSNTSDEIEWITLLASSTGTPLEKLKFLDRPTGMTLLVWSEQVSKDAWLGNSLTTDNELFLIIYIVVVVAIGLVIRNFTSGLGDGLWMDRMENPQRLYEQLLMITAHGLIGDVEKERLLADEFLNTLRSREKILRITGTVQE